MLIAMDLLEEQPLLSSPLLASAARSALNLVAILRRDMILRHDEDGVRALPPSRDLMSHREINIRLENP